MVTHVCTIWGLVSFLIEFYCYGRKRKKVLVGEKYLVSILRDGFDEAEVDGQADEHDDAVQGEEDDGPEVRPSNPAPEIGIVLLHFVSHFWIEYFFVY